MSSKRNILVGIDFSPGSRKAFDAAMRLAIDLRAGLVVVHALSKEARGGSAAVEALGFVDPGLRGLGASGEAAEAGAWADEARRAGIDVEVAVHEGRAAAVIEDEARMRQAALVVVGSSGKTGLRRMFLGSVAQSVIRHSPAPVLVTPVRMGTRPSSRPVTGAGPVDVAVDLGDGQGAVVEAGLRLAHDLKLPVRLTHVVQVPLAQPVSPDAPTVFSPELLAREEEAAALRLAALASEAPRAARAEPNLLVGDPASCIAADARASNAALVVVGTHGRRGLDKLMMGSVAQGVIQLADCPVLVVPDRLAAAG